MSPSRWKCPISPERDGMPASLVSWALKVSRGWQHLEISKDVERRKTPEDVFTAFANTLEVSMSQWNYINEMYSDICQEEQETTDQLDQCIKILVKKCAIKQESVTFFGGVFSAEGYSPDPEKIQGISEMTPPQMKQKLQSFLGAVNYLQMFVPHLSSNTEPLCALLKKENCLAWDENTNTCFQKIKSQLQKALLRPLRYYDRTKLVTLQCNASLKGLGACIIQEGQPIAFASKSCTDTKTRYANIKRELLAIIYGCEKFHTYLYGRTFIVETDHKPFEMISLKNLTAAPAQLQRMLLHLQQYDLIITYRPGKEMLLADALSHLLSRTNTEIKLDL